MISSDDNIAHDLGDGISKTFTVPFRFFASTDLIVCVSNADGTDNELTLGDDYSVAGAGDAGGGSVTLAVAPVAGRVVTRARRAPALQTANYVENDGFPGATHELVVDKLAAAAQDTRAMAAATMRQPLSDLAPIGPLPPKVARIGKMFGFDANGDPAALPKTLAEFQADVDNTAAAAVAAANSEIAAAGFANGASASEGNALASKNAAAVSEANAHASDLSAAASAAGALASKNAAAVSEANAAIYAAALQATSASNIEIATGAQNFVTQAGKQFAAGQFVLVVDQADAANYLHGRVTSYIGTALAIDVTAIGGAGTKSAWNIFLSGIRGAIGATGATGAKGDTGAVGATGAKGDTGAVGAAGAKGDKGDTGDQGPQGVPGPAGTGSGDVLGPAANADLEIVIFDGVDSKTVKGSGVFMSDLAPKETVVAMAAADMDLAAGTVFTKTLTAALTLTLSNIVAGSQFTLRLTNGGAYTFIWPSFFRWPGGTAPTLTAAGTDVISGISDDGVHFDVAALKDSK